ncbi:uncharacterized protein TNCV_3656591 [Trichonephila clavipes]|nr:uncharacterized protein TNCV_3656591 [Trichonephila clavipes]
MPGKRARRPFSVFSEFERGLIIGMKAAGWSTCRVTGKVDHSYCAVRNCWEQWTREEHVWNQLKQRMPSCHSVHDLEWAVQDLWVHLPRDNIRRLINSMPDRVEACIAAGGGPTRF